MASVPEATAPPGGHDHAGMPVPEPGTSNLESSNPRSLDPGSQIPDPESREIVLTPEMVQRAGIRTVAARKGTAAARLHLPGVVQPNAYKNVDDVVEVVDGAGLSRKVARMRPLGVIKG